LSADVVAELFPFDPQIAIAANPLRYNEALLKDRVGRYRDFAAEVPQLLPANIRSPAFIAKLGSELVRFVDHKTTINRFLNSNPDFIALTHRNASIDNAWFWRDSSDRLQCGLMDWGGAGQMNIAVALWGCLIGAEPVTWDNHLDELLDLFVDEIRENRGPHLDPAELKLYVELHGAITGLNYLLDLPSKILFRLPEAKRASGPHDEMFDGNDEARCQLNMLSVFLNLWETHDVGASLDRMLAKMRSSWSFG
jgi:hypothetical protein